MPKLVDLSGRRYGLLTVTRRDPEQHTDGRVYWLLQCECGRTVSRMSHVLQRNTATSCGCVPQGSDPVGRVYGALTVLARKGYDGRRFVFWDVRCSCGTTKTVRAADVHDGKTTSCGCRKLVHGMSKSSEFRCWSAMKNRCLNSRVPAFHNYGGRGILVCERWLGDAGFSNFLADMGPRPAGFDLDRIDNNGNYEPGNCRWTTRKVNGRNRRTNALVMFQGKMRPISECAELSGVAVGRLYSRIGRGWDIERAIAQPAQIKSRRAP